jgi:hypothetical protein
MSWSGTVTCSECYRQGHNRRSCPDLTERYQRYFAEAEKRNDHYEMNLYAKKLIKRTGINPITGEKRKKQRGRCLEYMQCSYCKNNGHTRRTCRRLKEDKQVFIHVTQKSREKIVQKIEARGLGVGTLIPYSHRAYNHEIGAYRTVSAPRFVVGYNWRAIKDANPKHLTSQDFVEAVDIRTLGSDGISSKFSLDYLDRLIGASSGETLQLSRSCDIRDRMPAGWLEAEDLDVSKLSRFQSGEQQEGRYGYWKNDHPEIMEARIALGFDEPETEE